MDNKVPVLFKNKNECCACGACLNVCPKEAIKMKEDEYGFLFPQIDQNSCIRCGKCKTVCYFQNEKIINRPLSTFAAVAYDSETVKKSASGGAFAALANYILENNGVVVGAELADFSVQHKCVLEKKDLQKLQGSKYTQSNMGRCYCEVKKYLDDNLIVLFSGTPCQITGLYGYLGKTYDNLFTVDIICHGVPNNRMFKEYINILGKLHSGVVKDFLFRDKNIGWGINGSAKIGKRRVKIWQSSSSYLYYFSKGWIYRESCYTCKYASLNRPADLTLGDYWGIEKQHPEYLGKNGWNEKNGISVVIANTQKGIQLLRKVSNKLELRPSTFEKASISNLQLKFPSRPGRRDEILKIYKDGGWNAMERMFKKNIGLSLYSSQIKSMIPIRLKRLLKAKK